MFVIFVRFFIAFPAGMLYILHGTKQCQWLVNSPWTGRFMKNTYDPQLIYDMFDRYGFKVLRIDQFDCGNFAKIRAELDYDRLTLAQLLEITTKLISLEKSENLEIHVVNIDMIHKTMRLNFLTREEEVTILR